MRVVCKTNKFKDIACSYNNSYSKYSLDRIFTMDVGDESNVYAIMMRDGNLYYLVWPSGISYVDYLPGLLFDVIDDRPSRYWISKEMIISPDSIIDALLAPFRQPRKQTLIGFPELVKEPDLIFYYIDDYADAAAIVNKNIKLIDDEYKIVVSLKSNKFPRDDY